MSETRKTIKEIEQMVRDLDANLAESDPAFRTAALLLSALHVGPNVERLVAFTSYPVAFVRERCRRFRVGKLFVRGKVAGSEWFDQESGGAAFWMDVLVGEGMLIRSTR